MNYDEALKAIENFIITHEVRNRERIKVKRKGNADTSEWNITQLHTVAIIKENNYVNNTFLADKLNISKAAVSKLIKKLLNEGMIKDIVLNDNRKEKYYELTDDGRMLADTQKNQRKKIEQKYINVFNKFNENELNAIVKFLNMVADG